MMQCHSVEQHLQALPGYHETTRPLQIDRETKKTCSTFQPSSLGDRQTRGEWTSGFSWKWNTKTSDYVFHAPANFGVCAGGLANGSDLRAGNLALRAVRRCVGFPYHLVNALCASAPHPCCRNLFHVLICS